MSLNDTTSSSAATPLISIASPRHLYALDGLRGVCAVTVMIGHIFGGLDAEVHRQDEKGAAVRTRLPTGRNNILCNIWIHSRLCQ